MWIGLVGDVPVAREFRQKRFGNFLIAVPAPLFEHSRERERYVRPRPITLVDQPRFSQLFAQLLQSTSMANYNFEFSGCIVGQIGGRFEPTRALDL